MSALEIIEQIKALPPEEKAVVADYVRQIDTPNASEASYMEASAFKTAKESVLIKHAELLSKLAK